MIIMITITITLFIIIRFPKASQCDRLSERRRLEQEGIAIDKVVIMVVIVMMMMIRGRY